MFVCGRLRVVRPPRTCATQLVRGITPRRISLSSILGRAGHREGQTAPSAPRFHTAPRRACARRRKANSRRRAASRRIRRTERPSRFAAARRRTARRAAASAARTNGETQSKLLGDTLGDRLTLDDFLLRLNGIHSIVANLRRLNASGRRLQFLNADRRHCGVQPHRSRGAPRRDAHHEREHDGECPPAMAEGRDQIAQWERAVHRRPRSVLPLLDQRLAHTRLTSSEGRPPGSQC